MKRIITAIGDPRINENLRNEKELEIPYKDIQYKEGILEILESDNKINYIIINEELPGNIEVDFLINKIKKLNINIKIFLINYNKKTYENKKENNIFYINNLEINNIKEKILEENIEQKIKNISEEKIYDKIQGIKSQEKQYEIQTKYIFVYGVKNIGKTLFSSILSVIISQKKYKVLIADNDYIDGNLHTIFQKKKQINKIIKINKNLDFICVDNQDILYNIEKKYNFIIIDNFKLEENKKIKERKIKNIFICEGNLIGIVKAQNEIKKITKENQYFKNVLIILNYFNKNSIDIKIIKNIFKDIKKIKTIKYNNNYNIFINNFNLFNFKMINKYEIKKITKKIIE